jgi:hypothetical protein
MPKEITDPKLLQKYNKLFNEKETIPDVTPENEPLDIARSIVKGIPGGTQLAAGIASLRPDMTYEKALERLKLEQQLAEERSPVLSTVGQIGGGVAATLPLGGIGAISKGMKGKELIAPLTKQFGLGAGLGGLEPVLEGKDVSDIITESGISGTGSIAFPVAGMGLKKASQLLEPVAKSTKQVSKDFYKNSVMSAFNVSKEYIDELEKNPKLFDQVMELPVDREKLGADLAKFINLNPYRQKVKALSEERDKLLLGSNKKINLKPMIQVFKNAEVSLPSKLSQSDEQLANALESYVERYGRGKQSFSVQETKQILDGLRGDIEKVGSLGDPTVKSGKLETILKNAQKVLNDEIGSKVPQYKNYQRQIQGNIKLSDILERKFLSKQASDLAIADATLGGQQSTAMMKEVDFGKLDAFRNRILSNKATKQDLRLASKMMIDGDYNSMKKMLDNIKMKEYVEARKNQGSNIRNSMIAIGGAVGSPFGIPGALAGSAGGGILGGVIEQKGGYYAGKAMQLPSKIAESMPQDILRKASGTKYGKVLSDAMSKGNKSFATTHYLLLQQDPEYRKQIEETE